MAAQELTFSEEMYYAQRLATERQAFVALYDHYFPRVYNYIRYRCQDPDLSDDLTAQVFELALSNLKGYNPQRAPFGAWLFAIARNRVSNHLRAHARRPSVPMDALVELPAAEPTPEESIIHSQAQENLLVAMQALSERERDLLSLRYAARLTNRRIAEVTGLSESNVGVILHRALERLRIALSGLEGKQV